ncbi:Crp/Fnr family transcriptional regulator [Streptomyces griseoincarnatus]|uniref:Crp/Fnr family transcriptional regulator n=1 Tax=Streptomyces griseoincarnatus TaxID=29305 RepID=A0ABT0W1I9_STRGI|nr:MULTISPECIES: Crp/Fnr family transcriptional regulator [Streptomyces]MBJ6615231.1 Crp/Fnr family transcriptional regulator [Streptomyces sp. I3(2020)]MBJ6625668.1 Crp/Fnr family transcriptional regulator [Streptomyces sp. I4(2020)]MCM2517452.1 Crp/Fnr family transcriptional regulator [Streptomyces griseoincarnatus]
MTSASYGPDDGGLEDRVPFLARLENEERTVLLGLGRELRFAPRVVLLHQREPSSHVLFLVQGWTKVTAAAANGYEALLALRGAGDVVGESAALTGRPRSATVTALEPVRAVAVEHARFKEFLGRSPAASFALLGLTADRTRAADRRRLEFASMGVRQRFAVLLLDLARSHGRRTPDGVELAVPLSKQELAGSVGASREMVQKLLRELRQKDAVSTGRRTLLVRRPDVLRRIATTDQAAPAIPSPPRAWVADTAVHEGDAGL